MHTGWTGQSSSTRARNMARMSVPGDLVAVQDPDVAGCLLVKLTVACCGEPFPPYGKP